MRRRAALRTIAFLGAVAVAGQAAGYTWLSRQDVAGTSRRSWGTKLDGGPFRVTRPNTWRLSVVSRKPEFRVLLVGPGDVRLEIAGSSLLRPAPEADETGEVVGMPALKKLHADLCAQPPPGISEYHAEAGEVSGALPLQSLVSAFHGVEAGVPVRGFRYTMLASSRVWSVLAVTPEERWSRALPLMKDIAASVEVP